MDPRSIRAGTVARQSRAYLLRWKGAAGFSHPEAVDRYGLYTLHAAVRTMGQSVHPKPGLTAGDSTATLARFAIASILFASAALRRTG